MKLRDERQLYRWALLAGLILLPVNSQGLPGDIIRPLTLQVGFEDLPVEGAEVEVYGGPGGGVYYNGSDMAGGFASEGTFFINTFNDWGGGITSWGGWAYSTTSDQETAGFLNEYSAFRGGPSQGEAYAVAYVDAFSGLDPLEIVLPVGWKAPVQVAVTNTTYAALAIRDGISGDFGVEPFAVGDYFKLTLSGRDREGTETGSVEVYLADYRGEAETHSVLETWQLVDLAQLGSNVATITLSLESTDVGQFGMNTPAYVAIDDLILGATPLWAGYDKLDTGWVDTGTFLGLVYPAGDYIHVAALNRYVYLPEAAVGDESGSWIYIPQ